ncbi:MAG: hypothetical protein JW731_07095 [Bacteroidales bacterium]|nr:hypothetical protein [Bacteroidales bacterium]
MKKLILITLTLLLFGHALGQTKILDSLNDALRNAKNDTLKLVLFRNISFEWSFINSDSTLKYVSEYTRLAKKLDYEINVADGLQIESRNYTMIGNYPRALEIIVEAKRLIEKEKKNNKVLPSRYLRMMDVPGNLTSYEQYSQWVLGNSLLSYWLLYWITDKKEVDSAINKVYEIAHRINAPDLAIPPIIWKGLKNIDTPDTALFYLKKAYQQGAELNNFKTLGPVQEAIAWAYFNKGDYENEIKYLRLGLRTNLRLGDFRDIGWTYYKLSLYFMRNSLEDSAIYYARKSWKHAVKGSYPDIEVAALEQIVGFYKNNSQIDSLNKYLIFLVDVIKRTTNAERIRQFENVENNQQILARELLAEKVKYRTRVKIYLLLAGLAGILALTVFLYRNNRQRKKANVQLKQQKLEVETQKNAAEQAYNQLKNTQAQLIQSEKMASLGELTAGIAHEIQNPLNFVNNFSEVNRELIIELKEELANGNLEEVKEIAGDLEQNEEMISHHGKRADAIVKGMLQHSRTSSGQKEPTDLNLLADEYLRLSYHGLRAKDKSFHADFNLEADPDLPKINVVPQDIGRVLLNLINNAFFAVNERSKKGEPGYKPAVTVTTRLTANSQQLIAIKDNGPGIPDEIKDKIFQPFFTTKPTGQGTGLGLSLSYDIVINGHSGKLTVKSEKGEGTEFIVQLPIN